MTKHIIQEARITEKTIDEREDQTYRRITQTDKDLAPAKQDKMIDVGVYLWQKNVMAKRAIDLQTNYVLAGGITYIAKDEKVKETLDKFWNDPVNAWDLKQDSRVAELSITGEALYQVFVNKISGLVRIGSIDPKQIDFVSRDEKNPEEVSTVKLKGDEKQYKVIRENKLGDLEGDVFFFPINKLSYQIRGISDLYACADWYDTFEQSMWTLAERFPQLHAFVYDVTIQGATEEQLKVKAAGITRNPPRPGSVRVHNEKETWEALTPNLAGRDVADYVNLIRAMAVIGSGFPAHIFGLGDDASNRSVAFEMNEPVVKFIKNRQKYIKFMFDTMFRYQIQTAKTAGQIPQGADETFSVIIKEPSTKDALKNSDVAQRITQALQTAVSQKWISRDSARKVIIPLLQEFGADIDIEKDAKLIDGESIDEPALDALADRMKKKEEPESEYK